MKSIKRLLNLYLPFSKAGIKIELAYKAQIVMWIIISLVETIFVVFLYGAIYRNSPGGMESVINGFSFYDMVLYMITSFFFSFVMGSGDTSYDIATDIREGTIANTLTKPVSYRLRHLFTYFGVVTLDYIVVIIPFLTIVYAIFIGFGMYEVSAPEFILNLGLFFVFSIWPDLLTMRSAILSVLWYSTPTIFSASIWQETLYRDFSAVRWFPLHTWVRSEWHFHTHLLPL